MSSFKQRPNKQKYLTPVVTLDEIHRGRMATFEEKKQSLPYKKEKLYNLNNQLRILESNKKNISVDDIKLRSSLKSEIKILSDEINRIENNDDVKEYYAKAGDILVSYYDITSGAFYGMECQDPYENVESDEDIKKHSLEDSDVDFEFEQDSDALKQLNLKTQSNRKFKKTVKKRKIIYDKIPVTKSILNFFVPEITEPEKTENKILINRATLQEKYLMLVDRNYACDHIKGHNLIQCTNCGSERTLVQSEGYYICFVCGEFENALVESEIPSHKDAINEKPKYPYKKLNHLKEKLNQLQSKETADIDDDVFEIIKKELKKQRTLPKDSTPPMIKNILKKHKLVECYEHLQQIYCKISGAPPVVLTRDAEEKVINMFNVMQDSYQRHRPANRSNFLNYSYVLNKIFKILGMGYHAKYFGLLKSKDKLREQDSIWAKICRDNNWTYHSSI